MGRIKSFSVVEQNLNASWQITFSAHSLVLLQKGDRVFCTYTKAGTYAEFALADETQTFHLSEKLSFEQGAGMGIPFFTAYKALMYKWEIYSFISIWWYLFLFFFYWASTALKLWFIQSYLLELRAGRNFQSRRMLKLNQYFYTNLVFKSTTERHWLRPMIISCFSF